MKSDFLWCDLQHEHEKLRSSTVDEILRNRGGGNVTFELPDANKTKWMSDMKEDQGLFTKENRPAVVQDLYSRCKQIPNFRWIQVRTRAPDVIFNQSVTDVLATYPPPIQ